MAEPATSERILNAALQSFATRGYEATSLDAVANVLGIRKQTILYWFPSKEALLDAVIDRAACDLASTLERTLERAGPGWERIDAIVKSVFRLGARQPELLGLVREVSRLGPPPATRLMSQLEPLVDRATGFLRAEMEAGTMRAAEPRHVLLAAYSMVIGMVTEVEVMRALGEEPSARSLIKRRAELLRFLRSALAVPV
ncbi:MAG: TetR/AcrR family transcriptional regulator [Actinomycetota bacterium]|jgi:TetR/AcrR family transcriptional regulator|nr:TetR/AcrR family transcriptional regulator [Actinomycetota bacterium]